jgi:DNA-binding CsgD family transcriptional regulator
VLVIAGREFASCAKRMSLPSEDWQKINACLLRLYRELDVEKHTRVMLEILQELVPGDSTVLNYFTPPDKLTAITLPENFASPEQTAQVGKYSYESPYAYYLTTEDAEWKRTTDFMPMEDFRKLNFYRLALAPLQINYQIGGMLASLDGTAHIITIHRTHENFTDREQKILNTLHPHLVTSHVNALVFSRAQKSVSQLKAIMETAPGASGCFDAAGGVIWLQEKAVAWLAEFFPGEVKHQGKVPQSVQALIARSQTKDGTPEHLEALNETERLTVMLTASPVGGWVLRLDRMPLKPASRFYPLTQLTPAENQVMRWMTEGKRNIEIGTILDISPRTVEKHVSQILAKLGAENRASAIIRAMEFCATARAAANVRA